MSVAMRRVSWREVAQRFTHIDGTLVEARGVIGGPGSKYVIRFYPWWEHPAYLAARQSGAPWGFRDIYEGAMEVTVWPIDLHACRLTTGVEILDVSFVEEHPLLWPYEDAGSIVCNSGFDAEELLERVMVRKPPGVTREALRPFVGWGTREGAPFALEHMARTPFNLIREALLEMGVRLFIPWEPRARETPIAFIIDGEDYLIATDFEVEVPEFEHRAEFFLPAE